MEGESCSLGGDEWRRDLRVDQRRLGFLEASLIDSILDAARDLFISLPQRNNIIIIMIG